MLKSKSNMQSLIAAGLGIFVGYFLFYLMFKSQCANLLIDQEKAHNETVRILQLDHEKLLAGCNTNQVDSRRDLSQMQGILDKQTSLASKYQSLLEKHEETLSKLSEVQKDNESSIQVIQFLQDKLERVQDELTSSSTIIEQTKHHASKQLESLTEQLELSKSMVRQKVEEVRALRVDGSCAGISSGANAGDHEHEGRLQAAVRRRDMAQCLAALGNGPYLVEFTLAVGSDGDGGGDSSDTATVQVEFRQLKEMPHTVWTFLSLVDIGLYVGTTIGGSPNAAALQGGAPSTATSKQIQSHLQRLYAEHGYGPEPFILEEVSPTAPCSHFTLGIVDYGPQFVIPMQGLSPQEAYMSRSCPGEVVSGEEILKRLRKTGERAIIRATRIVRRRAGTGEL